MSNTKKEFYKFIGQLNPKRKSLKIILDYVNELEEKVESLREYTEKKFMKDWISVKDQLPTEEYEKNYYWIRRKYYIVLDKMMIVSVASFRLESYDGSYKNYFKGINGRTRKSVTHWMPLPEPPERKKWGDLKKLIK